MGSIKGRFLPGAPQKDDRVGGSPAEREYWLGRERGREAGKASTIKVSAGVRPLHPT